MALIFLGQSRCALCDTILTETDQIVATSHFIADRQHPLWCFSDAGMHQTCFLVWEQREAFITLFNADLSVRRSSCPSRWAAPHHHLPRCPAAFPQAAV
jgi:hypothetical protein